MGVRGAQNGGMQRARPHRQVVGVVAAPGEQRAVLDALDRATKPAGFRCIL
jgi:hypothetical protein